MAATESAHSLLVFIVFVLPLTTHSGPQDPTPSAICFISSCVFIVLFLLWCPLVHAHCLPLRPVTVGVSYYQCTYILKTVQKSFIPIKLSLLPWNFYHLSWSIQCHINIFNAHETHTEISLTTSVENGRKSSGGE
jgi:hypothetical protein